MSASRMVAILGLVIIIIQATDCKLKSHDVIEGNQCLKDPKPPSGVDIVWLFQRRNYFVPLASDHVYRHHFEVLTGQSAQSHTDLNQLNLRISYTGGVTTTSGLGQNIYQVCTPWAFQLSLKMSMDVICTPTYGTEKSNITKLGVSRHTVAWTDNKSAILITRCVHETEKDWEVLTLQPTIDDETRRIILGKVHELGFSKSNAYYLPYYEKDNEQSTTYQSKDSSALLQNPLKTDSLKIINKLGAPF